MKPPILRLAEWIERYGAALPLARPRAGLWLALERAQLLVDVVHDKARAESVLHWEFEHPDAQELLEQLEAKYGRISVDT